MTLRQRFIATRAAMAATAPRATRGTAWRALMMAAGVGLATLPGGCSDPEDLVGAGDLGPVVVRTLDGPVPVLAEGQIQVVYEIDVFNPAGNGSVRLAGLTITAGTTPVADYSAGELQQLLSAPGLTLAPGDGRLAYVWLTFPANGVPATLTNTMAFANTEETRHVVVDVVSRTLTAVGAPLEGDGWVAVNIGNQTGHRRAVYTTPANEHRLAQRFAIDWVRIDEGGETFTGDPRLNESYFAYGQPILAVADGQIAYVQDGIPENVPGSIAVEITLATLGGNYVSQDLGNGASAFYAHLIPGSLRVAAGDQVRAGDTLAFLGNSGQSDQPHLHLHFARTYAHDSSAVDADGLPFVFESFEIRANRPVLGMRVREMPLNEGIIRFN